MSISLSLSIDPASAVKAATLAAVDAVGGVSAASALLGIGVSTVSKYVSPAAEWSRNVIRADLAVTLDRAAGHPFIGQTMDRLRSETLTAPTAADLTDRFLLRLDRVLDDVVREVAEAMEDGRMDAAERQVVRARIVAAQQSLAHLSLFVSGI
jgi:hypothetical protein